MPYLGNPPAEAYTSTVKDSFSGDGSTTAFTLSQPSTTNDLRVVVENVIQDPTVAYSVSGTTLTFTSAPPSGTDNIYAVNLGPAVQTAVPPDGVTLTNPTVTGDLTVDTNTLFVDSTNNWVGLGTVSPTKPLHILSTLPDQIVLEANSTTIGPNIIFKNTDDNLARIASAETNTLRFEIGPSNTEVARIDSDGLKFNGDTAAANALDDYEEGTFSPVLSGYTGVTGTLTGKYTKIGNMVYCEVYMNITALTYSGNTRITGWPFTPSGTINYHTGQGTIATGSAINVNPWEYFMGFYNQTANLYLYQKSTGNTLSGNNYRVGVLGIKVSYRVS